MSFDTFSKLAVLHVRSTHIEDFLMKKARSFDFSKYLKLAFIGFIVFIVTGIVIGFINTTVVAQESPANFTLDKTFTGPTEVLSYPAPKGDVIQLQVQTYIGNMPQRVWVSQATTDYRNQHGSYSVTITHTSPTGKKITREGALKGGYMTILFAYPCTFKYDPNAEYGSWCDALYFEGSPRTSMLYGDNPEDHNMLMLTTKVRVQVTYTPNQ